MAVEAKTKLEIVEIRAAYELGKRHFPNSQLQRADLRGIQLSDANLSGANLAGADLRDANLERVNLRGANLEGANLSRAHLKQAYLQGAKLHKAYFTQAELKEVNFASSDLEKAHFNQADLVKAIFHHANLQGAFLIGADLTEAKLTGANLGEAWFVAVNLHHTELAGAFYNTRTHFDEGFSPIDAGMMALTGISIEEVIAVLNYIYQSGCKYLGKTIAGKYWRSTCPYSIWLERFPISSSNEIGFTGDLSESIGYVQMQEFREWINRFVGSCGSIVRDFTLQLQRERTEKKLSRWLDI
jgi:Pentapeptide repeats (8 copies)